MSITVEVAYNDEQSRIEIAFKDGMQYSAFFIREEWEVLKNPKDLAILLNASLSNALIGLQEDKYE